MTSLSICIRSSVWFSLWIGMSEDGLIMGLVLIVTNNSRYYWKTHLGNFVGSRKYSQCSPFSCVFLGLFGEEVSDLHRVDPLNSFKIGNKLTELTVLVSIAEYDEMCWSFSGLRASAEARRFFAKAVRVDLIPWVPVVHRPMVTIFSCLNLLFNLHECS